MTVHPRSLLVWSCSIFLLAAGAGSCAAWQQDEKDEPPAEEQAAAAEDETEPDDEETDPVLDKLVEQATADLAERLSLAADDVEVVRAERVTWRDGSLGCPEPGMMYMQMLQDGVLIELRAGDQDYRYHSTLEGPPFYCEKPAKTPPLPAEREER